MAADFLAEPAVQALFAALPGARAVGGCVRDALAGRPSADIDLATALPPDETMRVLLAAGIKSVPTGLDHGTVTAVLGGRGYEVTTLRRDVATDGRHAVVAWTDDWAQDAARRDFTINAMSMTPDGALFDYFGGAADLRAGRVRFVGDAALRLAEDHLRILRFFRFQARYGAGSPDPAATAAVAAAANTVTALSPERVWSELKRILAAPDPAAAVELMAALGVLDQVIPEGADPEGLARLAGGPGEPLLRLAALLTGDPARLAERLRLSGEEAGLLSQFKGAALPADASDAELRRARFLMPLLVLEGRSWLAGTGQALRDRLAATAVPAFDVKGRDAVALGVPPGPRVGALVDATRAWWMARGCTDGADACRAELARLAQA